MIKGILLDYGGTIDTNGIHWGVVLKDSYAKCGLTIPDELFSKAYSFGEKSLAINPLVKPSHTFLDVLRLKIEQQFSFLKNNGIDIDSAYIERISVDCNNLARNTVNTAIPTLNRLAEKFPVVIVSNFYGNLCTVLEDFGIRKIFSDVVESAVVGIRKPDPAIYQYGVDLLHLAPEECVVIGDSFTKDIIPAKKLGCKAIWLNAKGWEEDLAAKDGAVIADVEVTDFSEVALEVVTLD